MKSQAIFSVALGGVALLAVHSNAVEPVSQQLENPETADVTIINHVLEPKPLPVKEHLNKIRLPAGFQINVFAEGLKNPRMLAVNKDGTVYVTRRQVGDVVMLRDENADGVADSQQTVARRPQMHGITIHGNNMYLVTVKEIYRTAIRADGTLGDLELLVDDLPDGGQHPNRTVAVGPENNLYVSVGSSCNACDETNPEHATMLQMELDGSSRSIFASGLRNTIGFGFVPETGEMYGMDHGIDWLGDNEQHEELNHIVKGNQYGWPYIYDDGEFNPQNEPPGDISLRDWAERSVEPVGFYTPHAAPMQMTFYTGEQFPAEYKGDAFVSMRGSWNRKPPSGYEVMRVRFDGGKPVRLEAFATGFLQRLGNDWGHQGRLAGMAQTPDGSLLITDDTNGIIYRIAYTGDSVEELQSGWPTNGGAARVRVTGGSQAEPRGENNPLLAVDQRSVMGEGKDLSVSSPAFDHNERIPRLFSAQAGENISPPLSWAPGPEGTESYVVIMEDPDVVDNPPFVHWLVYNIAADVTGLPKGIPGLPELAEPEGALQGRNDRGEIGYFGPKPPPVDPEHHYHFQVFALDTELDIKFGATRDELLAAMEGHVLAADELIGTYIH